MSEKKQLQLIIATGILCWYTTAVILLATGAELTHQQVDIVWLLLVGGALAIGRGGAELWFRSRK